MSEARSIVPTSLLETTFEVQGIVKPTLARLGLTTVGQLAAIEINDLRRIKGIGQRKLNLLIELSEKSRDVLKDYSDHGQDAASSTGPTINTPITDLMFVPSLLKNALANLEIDTIHKLIHADDNQFDNHQGWGPKKITLFKALKSFYSEYVSQPDRIHLDHTVGELGINCLLPSPSLLDVKVTNILHDDLEYQIESGTQREEFIEFRNLLRLLKGEVSTHAGVNADAASYSNAEIPDTPLIYIPSLLRPLFQKYGVESTSTLFELEEWGLREQGGWGERKIQACLTLQRLYAVLYDPQIFQEISYLSDIPGASLALEPHDLSISIDELINNPKSFSSNSGHNNAEIEDFRILIGLGYIRNQKSNNEISTLSFLVGFSQPKMHWEEVPLNLPPRVVSLLKKYNIDYLQQIDDLSITSYFLDPESNQKISISELPKFTAKILLSIRKEMLRLGALGLAQYRYGSEGAPKTCSELMVRLRNTLSTRGFDILKRRFSDETLEDIADVLGITRERVRQVESSSLKETLRFKTAAEKILVPVDTLLREKMCTPLTHATELLESNEDWETMLLAKISGINYFKVNEGKQLSIFSPTDIESLKSVLNDDLFISPADAMLSVRESLKKSESNSKNIQHCKTLVKERDVIAKPADFARLFGNDWIVSEIKTQIYNAGYNGLYFDEIKTLGRVHTKEELESLLSDDVDILPDGRFRSPRKSYSKKDDLIEIVRKAGTSISLKEISELLSTEWVQPHIVRTLSESLNTFQCGPGQYIHLANTELSRHQCLQIAEWGANILAGEKKTVEGEILLDLYREVPEFPPLENDSILISLIAKHKDVQRYSSTNSLYHCESLDESNTFLAVTNPEIASEWNHEKNGEATPENMRPASNKVVWWKCKKGHEYQASVAVRTRAGQGCPSCAERWTLDKVREFVRSLQLHLDSLTPAELYVIFQQSGLLNTSGKARSFVKALSTGRFPKKELEQFLDHQPSLVDNFLDDSELVLEDTETSDEVDLDITESSSLEDSSLGECDSTVSLPEVKAKNALDALASEAIASADGEAADFLLASAKGKIWSHAYINETEAVEQAESSIDTEYAIKVGSEFLDEYRAARNLKIPPGYSFSINNEIVQPNLMQRLVAVRVRDLRRFGNWSGTGAGKTLSAILATRVTNSKLTVICCPNSVVGDEHHGWFHEIISVYPDSDVCTKTWNPKWKSDSKHRYLVLNYEMFQQPSSEAYLKHFLNSNSVDFIVIDEIHYAKQRQAEEMSRRKRLVMAMISEAGENNPNLCVLGMSATPVINNLQEGRSLIELITGYEHNDLEVKASVSNCMKLHQRLVTLGTRWRPRYSTGLSVEEIPVDCSEWLPEIRNIDKNHSPLEIEKILTHARLPTILELLEPGRPTLIYTHYVKEIEKILYDAASAKGLRVGFFTGQLKDGLDKFKAGRLDVLIGSSAIGTGVDGLQKVCSQLIINTLPWTNAEYEQLIGRVWRQGQTADSVKVVIPVTYANVSGTRWSYCETKLNRIQYKKSIADAAVDGVVPEGNLRSPAQAHKDLMAWLDRIDSGQSSEKKSRKRIIVPLSGDLSDVKRRQVKYGDFSQLNNRWNKMNSSKLAERLQANPEEWEQYHTLYREARSDWTVLPVQEMINWCMPREGYQIGDFGCGERLLGKAVSERHHVYSFDHIAIDDNVIEGDMSNTPLDDNTLDVSVFCLSLMGNNISDYVKESHRVLKIDGQMHIWEPTSRFENTEIFCNGLEALGFQTPFVETQGQFTHIHTFKTDRLPHPNTVIRFK